MAKSLRSKREKRLRAIRREMVEPYYDQKDAAKLAAQQAAMAAPKLPVRTTAAAAATTTSTSSMATDVLLPSLSMDVDMADNGQGMGHLKPVGGVGKKLKKKLKLCKGKKRGKGKIRRKHI